MKSLKSLLSREEVQSPAERRFLDSLEYFGLHPEVQYPVKVFYLDFAFPDEKLAIEIDGQKYHSSPYQREKDAFRQKKIEELGWKFERFAGWMLWRNQELPASKLALKYFSKKLSREQKNHALGVISQFFAWNDPELATNLVNQGLGIRA